MIDALVAWAVRHRLLVVILVAVLAVLGIITSRWLRFDALPDVTGRQVVVLTEAPGLTPEEVELRVTRPVETALGGLPGLVTAIVKRIIGRGRPVIEAGAPDFQLLAWLDWTYQSFPSGHATTGFALCFTVSFLAPRAFAWMLMLALLISMSRIVVGAHYATDIVGGAIIGTLGAYLVRNVFASRGWLFEARSDGAIALKPLDAIRDLMRPRS